MANYLLKILDTDPSDPKLDVISIHLDKTGFESLRDASDEMIEQMNKNPELGKAGVTINLQGELYRLSKKDGVHLVQTK